MMAIWIIIFRLIGIFEVNDEMGLQQGYQKVEFGHFRDGKNRHTFICSAVMHLGYSFSSQVINRIWLFTTRVLAQVMLSRMLRLVTDVAEKTLTLLTSEQILSTFLPVDTSTTRTLAAELDIDIRIFLHAHVSLNKLDCDIDRLLVTLIWPVIWLLFEMLLTFSLLGTDPTEPLPAFSALHLRAAAPWYQGNWCITLRIRTSFGAMFHVDFIESILHKLVLLSNFTYHALEFNKQVNSVN